MSSVSLSDLLARGLMLRPHEAVAVAQTLIHRPEASESIARAPYGPPTPGTVEVSSDGSVVCTCSAATPAVSEVAILLHALLPPEKTRVPGGLRYAIGRALLEVEGPPFDSIEDFSLALSRYERGEREEVVRSLVDRSDTRPGERIGPAARFERRRAGAGVDELRRQLREADRRYYEALVAFYEEEEDEPPQPSVRWRAPAAVAAGLAAAIALIAAGQLRSDGGAPVPRRAAPASSSVVERTAVSPPVPVMTTPVHAVQTPSVAAPPRDRTGSAGRKRAARPSRDLPENNDDRTVVDMDALVPALDAQHRPIFSPAFASNGTAMFFHTGRTADARSALMAVDVTSPDFRVISIVEDGARNYHVQPSPDGRLIAFDSERDGERGVYIANRDGSRVRRVSGPGYAAVPSWAPDSRRLAFVRADRTNPKVWNLWLLGIDSGDLRQLTHHAYGQTWSASWFPDGQRLCYTHEDTLVLLDLITMRTRQFDSPIPHRLVRTPAVSPDGSKIIFQIYREGVWLLDLRDGSMRSVLTDPSAEEFAWAPDGRRVAFHSRRDGQWGIYLVGAGS